MQLDTPEAWLVSAVDSGGQDLDSLSGEESGSTHVRYKLEALFIEGWARMAGQRAVTPAMGRQLALSPPPGVPKARAGETGAAGRDSVVVKSGYFQLRAPPGLYELVLRGKGKQEERLLSPSGAVALVDLVGRSRPLQAVVGAATQGAAASRRDDAEAEQKATESYDGAGGDPSACKDTIHVFSVASGHRYERLLRIMITSVREHTKCPLRLWLVENFLSPSFRRVLPAVAKEVGFAVSQVTYKWPEWLRAQTQKQRVIWAYKILFLDVFFPSQVKRVMFIDADQIVRADVKEVYDTNMDGHVYGFVPFCGSGPKTSSLLGWSQEDLRNPDTNGFRFWEQGYWSNHLGPDRYYHISALFVVDLELFRQRGAGDILRGTYQSLTADPNSLANLDQDLPNFVQGQLPIFTLPQEWLWCETWCSEASKARAKTIDMCQNPLKKEGKIAGARRIAPEWDTYDKRIEAVLQRMNASA